MSGHLSIKLTIAPIANSVIHYSHYPQKKKASRSLATHRNFKQSRPLICKAPEGARKKVLPFSHPRIAGSRLRYLVSTSTCPSSRSDSSMRFSGLSLKVSPALISPLGRLASTTVLYVAMAFLGFVITPRWKRIEIPRWKKGAFFASIECQLRF